MTKIVPAVTLCLFPLAPLSAASLCDESGCTIHLVFEAGGGIRSDHGFTLNLGADGRIVDASLVSDVSAGGTSTVNAIRDYTELTFTQGGEIVIVGGNLSYPNEGRVQISGLSAARVAGGSQVSIGTVDTAGTVSFKSPLIGIATAVSATGLFFNSSSATSTIDVEAGTKISVGVVTSAAVINFINPFDQIACQLAGETSVALAVDTSLPACMTDSSTTEWEPTDTRVTAIWIGQNVGPVESLVPPIGSTWNPDGFAPTTDAQRFAGLVNSELPILPYDFNVRGQGIGPILQMPGYTSTESMVSASSGEFQGALLINDTPADTSVPNVLVDPVILTAITNVSFVDVVGSVGEFTAVDIAVQAADTADTATSNSTDESSSDEASEISDDAQVDNTLVTNDTPVESTTDTKPALMSKAEGAFKGSIDVPWLLLFFGVLTARLFSRRSAGRTVNTVRACG